MKLNIFSVIFLILLMMPALAADSDMQMALMNKDYEQVKTLAQEALKGTTEPGERIEAQYYLGLSFLRLSQFPEARSAFQIVMAAAESKDLYDRAALGMIEALYIPGFYNEALSNIEQLLHKSPRSAFLSTIYLKKARLHLKLTQWGLAKEYLQKIIKEFPGSLEAVASQKLMEEKEYFTVQVGSFLDKEKADKLTDKLKTEGQYAYILESSNPDGKTYYRVRVGQKVSLSDAQSLQANLSNSGYPALIYP